MKHVWLLLICAAFLGACGGGNDTGITVDAVKNPASASSSPEDVALPVMTFETDVQNFGTIVQGEKVRKTFAFTNTGEAELIITSATGSCGCTVPEYPRKPIKPGESSQIEVIFNSDGKSGRQHKKIYIVANTQPPTNTLAITGDVVGPNSSEAQSQNQTNGEE